MFHVLHYADDFNPGRLVQWSIKANAFPHRLLIGPVLSGECFIDDHHWWRAGLVLFCKPSTAAQTNSHCLKVVGRTDAITAVVLLPGWWFRSTFDQIII